MRTSKIKLRIISLLCFSFLLTFSSHAYAISVQCLFSGEITYANGSTDLLNEISIGTIFYGSFKYDTENPAIFSMGPDHLIYDGTGEPISISFIGTNDIYTISGTFGAGIGVSNDSIFGSDGIYFPYIMDWSGDLAGYCPDEGSLELTDASGNIFSSTDLPSSLSINDFDDTSMWIFNAGDPANFFELCGEIQQLKIIPTPEPSTLILLGLGGLLGCFFRRSRGKNFV